MIAFSFPSVSARRRLSVACVGLVLFALLAPTALAQIDTPVLLRTARGGGYLTLSPSGVVDSDRDRVLSNPRSHWFFERVPGRDVFRIRNHGTGLYLYASGSDIASGRDVHRADYHWRVERLRGYLRSSQRYMSSYRLINAASNQYFAGLPRRGMWAPSAPEMQYNSQNWVLFDPNGTELDVAIQSDREAGQERRRTMTMRLAQASGGCYMGTTNPGVDESWFLLTPTQDGFTLAELRYDAGDRRHPGRGWHATYDAEFEYADGAFRSTYGDERFAFHYDVENPSRTRQIRARNRNSVASSVRSGTQTYYYKVPLASTVTRTPGTTRWTSCGPGCEQPWTTPPPTISDSECQRLMGQR